MKDLVEVCPDPRPPPPPAHQKLSPPTPFADTTAANCCFTKPGVPGGRVGEAEVAREKKEVVLTTNLTDPSPFPSPHSQAAGESRNFLEPSNLSCFQKMIERVP